MSNKFNLEDYKTVQQRISEFWDKYPMGSIQSEIAHYNTETGFVLFKATVYSNIEKGLIVATGFAEERRDFEKQKNSYGKEFESVNFTSHVENAETSAIGRALANAGFASSQKDRPSREEMEKVQRYTKKAPLDTPAVEKQSTPPVVESEKPQIASTQEPPWDDSIPKDFFVEQFKAAKTRAELQKSFAEAQIAVKNGEQPAYNTRQEFVSAWQTHILAKLKSLH
jgi:hypothetical protein